jgi:hypothetical protein
MQERNLLLQCHWFHIKRSIGWQLWNDLILDIILAIVIRWNHFFYSKRNCFFFMILRFFDFVKWCYRNYWDLLWLVRCALTFLIG